MSADDGESGGPRIQSLARADAILTAVMRHDGPAPLSVVADAVGLNKTTVFNLAESLVALGFLARTRSPKGYVVGLRCLELGRHVSSRLPVLEASMPAMLDLCRTTRETVNLALPYLHEAILVESLESGHGVRATAYAGAKSSYHSSACGKALFAFFPEERRRWHYEHVGLERVTEFTICDPELLEAQLADIRAKGFATEVQENELGAACIGMPIFGPFNEIVAAISVAGVLQRMTPQRIEEIRLELARHTKAISQTLARG